jgi:hypothetical protein
MSAAIAIAFDFVHLNFAERPFTVHEDQAGIPLIPLR